MDMVLAILSVIVFVAWCILKHDLDEASKLPREEYKSPKKNWHPSWHNREIDE